MGIISLIFIAVILGFLLINFKQKLSRCKKDYQESFVALRIALACRHQAVRHVLDASKIYLGREGDDMDKGLLSACGDAEAILSQASKSFSGIAFPPVQCGSRIKQIAPKLARSFGKKLKTTTRRRVEKPA